MARVVLGALALSLVLAGCGGDPEAPPDPTATTSGVSTTPSTPPTPSAPALPEAAMANTKAGAIAFVRHYVDLINHAQRTGDVEVLAAVEAAGCESCASGRKYLRDVYGAGGHINGGELRVEIAGALRNRSIDGWTIDGRLEYGPQTVIRPTAPTPTEHLTGGGVPITVLLSLNAGTWTVAEWTRAQ